jgi:hypothetical protein
LKQKVKSTNPDKAVEITSHFISQPLSLARDSKTLSQANKAPDHRLDQDADPGDVDEHSGRQCRKRPPPRHSASIALSALLLLKLVAPTLFSSRKARWRLVRTDQLKCDAENTRAKTSLGLQGANIPWRGLGLVIAAAASEPLPIS